jgi:hypothetical protein
MAEHNPEGTAERMNDRQGRMKMTNVDHLASSRDARIETLMIVGWCRCGRLPANRLSPSGTKCSRAPTDNAVMHLSK